MKIQSLMRNPSETYLEVQEDPTLQSEPSKSLCSRVTGCFKRCIAKTTECARSTCPLIPVFILPVGFVAMIITTVVFIGMQASAD